MQVSLPSVAEGDNLLLEYIRLRNLMQDRAVWPDSLQRFAFAWEDFKKQVGGIDFTDMIDLALQETDAPEQHPEVLIADEAQDLSRLQFALLTKWSRSVEKVVLAFDPDQSIYGFSGADPAVFVENEPERLKVLEQSYRVPAAVHADALAWIEQLHHRRPVTYRARSGEAGQTGCLVGASWQNPSAVVPMILEALGRGKTVMYLASCSYMLTPMVQCLRDQGVPFHNPYRRRQGAWNPLGRTSRGLSTADRLLALLAPFEDGAERLWTKDQLLAWSDLVKGCWRRGGRKQLDALPQSADGSAVLMALLAAMSSEEDVAAVMAGPPDVLQWVQGHFAANKVKVGTYMTRVLARMGSAGLREAPRVVLGTIHSVKGAEADVVLLAPDLSQQGFEQWLRGETQGRGAIVRQFYVGMTRAREELWWLSAGGNTRIDGYHRGAFGS